MRSRRPLPAHLTGASFHVSEVVFHELTPARLRSPDLDAPFHGVRSVGLHLDDVMDRARMYAPRLRDGQLYSHVTAAQLLGIPLPLGLQRSTVLHVASLQSTAVRTHGVIGHELLEATPFSVEELTVTSPAETWCQLSALITREELVAAGDYLISGKPLHGGGRMPALCTLDQLTDAVRRFGRRRGAAALKWALPRLRPKVDSPRESFLRLAIVAAGLPEPVVAHPVAVAGGVVLHPDLGYPDSKLAIEYEGDEHRTNKRRWRADLRRVVLLEEAGWRVLRATDDDIRDPRVITRVIRTALRDRTS
jgi:hypothetical protein